MVDLDAGVPASDVIRERNVGTLVKFLEGNDEYTAWLPDACVQASFDEHGRIGGCEGTVAGLRWEFQPVVRLIVSLSAPRGESAVIPYVALKDPGGRLFDELARLGEVERQIFRKSEWFHAGVPGDVWRYLINGSVYDPRQHDRVRKRFKCQQCAYAWWSYFGFLRERTGKRVYDVLRDEVAYSVLLDMLPSGEWGHGFWSDRIETHARFHLDGLHLLISQYERTGDPLWLEGAERGMGFVRKSLTDRFDDGRVWFLHDTIEQGQPHRFRSTVFGKSAGNSLCVNTHVQALTVLHRLAGASPRETDYAELFESGTAALRRVLDHQPGGWVWRFLMPLVLKWKATSMVRSDQGRLRRVLTELRGALLTRAYWRLRRRLPRLVQPGGFIERDLTLSLASDEYHLVNVKDLLVLYRAVPAEWLRRYIEAGFAFLRRFVREVTIAGVLRGSPYYVELVDVFHMYGGLIEPIPAELEESVEAELRRHAGGLSLDRYASELVQVPRSRVTQQALLGGAP